MLTPLSRSTLPFTSKMISGVRKNKQIQYGASGRIATLRLNNILSNFQVNVSYELLYLISGHVAEGRGARVGGEACPPIFETRRKIVNVAGNCRKIVNVVGNCQNFRRGVGWGGGEGEYIE